MKKLLIFMLVLGLASAANATLSLKIDDAAVPGSISIEIGETIQIYSSDASTWVGYLFVTEGSQAGSLTNGRLAELTSGEPGYAGDGGNIAAVTEAGFGVGYLMGADYVALPPVAGVQLLIDFTAPTEDIGKTGVINLWIDPDYTNAEQSVNYTIIPEPMTVLLLGLGGLLLRRRKGRS